jgi:hypothetical protein
MLLVSEGCSLATSLTLEFEGWSSRAHSQARGRALDCWSRKSGLVLAGSGIRSIHA